MDTQNVQHTAIPVFHQKKKRNKVSVMPRSTYLFIPCPQSNAKKCYAKELKGKIKIKKYQNGNYKFIDLFI